MDGIFIYKRVYLSDKRGGKEQNTGQGPFLVSCTYLADNKYPLMLRERDEGCLSHHAQRGR